jgi:adenine-specific DNA-methyltransferase
MRSSYDNEQLSLPVTLPGSTWRPIHYLGSKLRLTETIRRLLDTIDPGAGPVLDLFAGSGTVSLALSQHRRVIAADIQEYSRVLCTAILRPEELTRGDITTFVERSKTVSSDLEHCLEPLLTFESTAIQRASSQPELLCELSEQSSLIAGNPINADLAICVRETNNRIAKSGLAEALLTTRYFGGSYFSFRQALELDAFLGAILGFRETYLAAILSTASTIVNSIGKQFAQPMRARRKDGTVKEHLIAQMCRDRTVSATDVLTGWLERYQTLRQSREHTVTLGDYRAVLHSTKDAAVIYADPPYTRDHYSRFYHVLETMCLRDSPTVSRTSSMANASASRGLYRTDRHQSPFCIRSKAPEAFEHLFEAAGQTPMLLSYSPYVKNGHPRLMTIESISALARKHYAQVEIVTSGKVIHSKLNKAELHRDASEEAEVFLVCRS